MTFRKGALTAYYPEETRSDYSPNNRGRHVLTQRANGEVQCVACNMCATACPAYCIEILVDRQLRRAGASEIAGAFRDRLLALHLLRILRGGLPRGCHPHGQGRARLPGVRSPAHVGQDRSAQAVASDQRIRASRIPSQCSPRSATRITRCTHDRPSHRLVRLVGLGLRAIGRDRCGNRCARRSRSLRT